MLCVCRVSEFFWANECGVPEGVKEAVAEEFDGGTEIFGGHAVEAAVGGEECVDGKDMDDVEMGVVDEVVAEGVDSGDGPMLPWGTSWQPGRSSMSSRWYSQNRRGAYEVNQGKLRLPLSI